MKPNVLAASAIGLVLGIAAEFLFAYADRVPVLGCLLTPVALLLGLGLPVIIGGLAAAWGARQGLMTMPTGIADGALAAALAELVSRLIGFCAQMAAARALYFGPRFLLPSVGPSTGFLFSGVWALGWFVVSIAIAALLGAIGGLLYNARTRR